MTPSNAGSNDQIVQPSRDESSLGTSAVMNLRRKESIHVEQLQHDGVCDYDPTLLHPIVHILCCCPDVTFSQDVGEEVVEAAHQRLDQIWQWYLVKMVEKESHGTNFLECVNHFNSLNC